MNSRSMGLARVCARWYCSGSPGTPSAHFQALKKKQARFQSDDGEPIWLKAGTRDKILYQTTLVLLYIGGIMMLKLFWDLAVPTKNT